jgi:hypothetical protein
VSVDSLDRSSLFVVFSSLIVLLDVLVYGLCPFLSSVGGGPDESVVPIRALISYKGSVVVAPLECSPGLLVLIGNWSYYRICSRCSDRICSMLLLFFASKSWIVELNLSFKCSLNAFACCWNLLTTVSSIVAVRFVPNLSIL